MLRVVQSEWYRGVHSWRFWVALALTVFILVLAMVQSGNPLRPPLTPRQYNFYTQTLMALGGYLDALWPVVLPAVAVLTLGDSLAIDRRRGVDTAVITRLGWARYLAGKWTGNALVSGVVVALAAIVTMGVSAITYPLGLPRLLGWKLTPALLQSLSYQVKMSGVFANTYPPEFQPHFFWAAPGLYLALAIVTALWATIAVSGLSVAAAIWIRPPIVTLVSPVVLFLAGDVLSQTPLMRGHLIPSVYAGAYLYFVSSPRHWFELALYWVGPIAVVGVLLSWMMAVRKEWPERSMGR